MTEAEKKKRLEQVIISAWYDLRGRTVTDGDRARSVISALILATADCEVNNV